MTTFRVWAPLASAVSVEVAGGPVSSTHRPLAPVDDGWFSASFDDVADGSVYGYVIDGSDPWPDPASRFQPAGIHAASQVIDPTRYQWSDEAWSGVPLSDLVIYELHVGTFTSAGTFAGVKERLPALRDLGITAIELMPIADFPGARNWGYDGVALFAPARRYGRPDDLRGLVDAAHRAGLAVLLDVVYNHTGPDGSYLSRFSPFYFSERHQSPWGAGMNFDGEHSAAVREFFIDNALHWVHEYHVDGLRLDATHAIQDDSDRHFVAALTERVKDSVPTRQVHVIAEDHRNLAQMVRTREQGGWGLDAVWADDFHHQIRRLLAGDSDGYFRDYAGTTADLARTARQGWFFTGQWSEHLHHLRGTDPAGLPPSRFVLSLQNHDQVGNRAFGERLHHQIPAAAFRAASVLFLLLPHTPLIFMGQEWAASSPFRYFTDHAAELGRLVTEGRRREFSAFSAFADPATRTAIPDPQALDTFEASRLDWAERAREPHASILRLYRTVLRFRRYTLAPGEVADAATLIDIGADTVALCRRALDDDLVLVVARLRGAGTVDLRGHALTGGHDRWETVFTSDDADFASASSPTTLDVTDRGPAIIFPGPAAVVLRARRHTPATASSVNGCTLPTAGPGARS